MAGPKVWFITGALSGFGRLLTEYLLKKGYRVVTTLLDPDALSDLAGQYPATCLAIKLDVTQHAEISAAFAKAKEAFGRVDVVFNNAGRMVNGELESVDEEDVRGMFEVNFWGAAQVTREAVEFFRDVNQPPGGRLLQMSSGLGIVSRPCFGHYSASKSALEALTEALAQELDPAWNIKITMLEPGPFLTEIYTTNSNVALPHHAYTNPALEGSKWRAIFNSRQIVDGDPRKACVAFEQVSELENPPIRLPLHKLAFVMAREKGQSLIEIVEKYENMFDDLYLSVAVE